MRFLRNTWYVAMWSQDLKPGELQQRLILDEAIVLFRNASGQVAALLDRCPHRFVPLSLGKVCEGNSVQCPYHGLAFDATGVCVRNPNAEGRIPPALRVRRFPVVERHGAIWVWMGDREADPALIPDFSVLDEEIGGQTIDRRWIRVAANYELMTYNILDISHTNTLHAGILGNEDTFHYEIHSEEKGNSFYLYRKFRNVRPIRVNQLKIGRAHV